MFYVNTPTRTPADHVNQIADHAQPIIAQMWEIITSSNLIMLGLVVFVGFIVFSAVARSISGVVRMAFSAAALVVGIVIFIHVFQQTAA